MPIPLIPAIFGIIKTAGGLFSNWQERKRIVSEGKIKITQAQVEGKIKREQSIIDGDIQYDLAAQNQMATSWKDEYLTILLSIPFILCFVPGCAEYVGEGFKALKDNTPEWYQWAFLGVVVASFGLKDWFKKLVSR
jgi:hypothetical protein